MERFQLRLSTGRGNCWEQVRGQKTHHPIHTLSSLIQSLKNYESSTPGLESQGGSSYICSHKGQMG